MKLSIITINKDNAEGLQKTLDSVACQTWHDFEHIIVDGASADSSVDIIRNYAADVHPYPVKWLSEPDTGIYNAMNKGIRMANGEYCLFLNSGDYLIDGDVLDKVFALNFNEDVVCGFSKFNYGDHYELSYSPRHITLLTFVQGTIHHSGNAFIKKSAFEKWGLYDESLKIVSDWKWFLMTLGLSNATYHKIDVLLSVFNCDGISQNHGGLLYDERKKVLSECLPERILKDYEYIEWLQQSKLDQELQIRSSWSYKLGSMIINPIKRILTIFEKKK